MKIAGAPISWGVCEVPDWGYQMAPERVLQEMKEIGLTATEFGPQGWLPIEAQARAAEVGRFDLTPVGAFFLAVMHDPDSDPIPAVNAELDAFEAAGGSYLILAAASGAEGYDARPVLDEAGWQTLFSNLDPTKKMKDLSIAQTQMVEIAKAISFDSKLIIMDEPTSAITETEVAHLHRMIDQLRSTGTAIIYITHKMDEVFKISDDITIFRDGKHVASMPAAELNRDKLIALMVGRELTQMFPKLEAEIGEVILKVENLHRGHVVKDVSFELHRGEILGFAGLMGAGRTEVLETIFGVFKADSGTISINGNPLTISQPKDAIAAGMALLTEDRKLTGIMGVLSVRDNMIMAALPKYSPSGFLQAGRIEKDCEAQREALALKTPSLDQLIQNLSGGNQQKVLISRWLLTLPDILMIDEPTRGIDVGAKSEIHRLMSMLAQQGKAIIMVSSEMPEVLGMSDRVVVMHEGRVSGVVDRADATQETIMQLATGPADQAA